MIAHSADRASARQGHMRTPSPPTKSLDFEGLDSSRLLILRGGIRMPIEFDRGSPGKFDSRTLNRKTLSRWTGRICACARSEALHAVPAYKLLSWLRC